MKIISTVMSEINVRRRWKIGRHESAEEELTLGTLEVHVEMKSMMCLSMWLVDDTIN
jgi:hypothetical protein